MVSLGAVYGAIRSIFGGKQIVVSSPSANQVLSFDGTKWVNSDASGVWTRTSTTLSPSTANDVVSIPHTSADVSNALTIAMGASTTGTALAVANAGTGNGLTVTGAGGPSQNAVGYFAGPPVAAAASGTILETVILDDTSSAAQGVGAGLAFAGRSNGTFTRFGGIRGYKESGTSANTAGGVLISTVANGALPTEAARFTSEHAFQIAASSGSTVGAAGTSALRSNAGTLEVSNNGGAWTAVSTGSSPFTTQSTYILTTSSSYDTLCLNNSATVGSPVTRVIAAPDATGSNVAGSELRVQAGAGTGSANGGVLKLRVAPAGSSGSSTNNFADLITLDCSQTYPTTVSGNFKADVVGVTSYAIPVTNGGADLGASGQGWKRLYLDYGIDTTAGDAATINKAAGRFRKDTSGTTFTLTNSYITANSIITLTPCTNDASGSLAWSVQAGSGSATITFNVAPSTDFDMNFLVINTD